MKKTYACESGMITLLLLQGVDGKYGDPGSAGEKGGKVRLMNI